MSAYPPLSGDKQTFGEQDEKTAHDPKRSPPLSYGLFQEATKVEPRINLKTKSLGVEIANCSAYPLSPGSSIHRVLLMNSANAANSFGIAT
jgi:hypothetical protein